jgi:16S rRNA (uracil1498-N3)-methyltransferase
VVTVSNGDRHVFRFFVDAIGTVGARLPLTELDRRHGEVLRLGDGDRIELVDAARIVWDATWVTGGVVELVAQRHAGIEPITIELYAGALTGNRFDVLVDGAVQAGATSIAPVVTSRRDGERLAARIERLQRVAAAAARQSKRTIVPSIEQPVVVAELPAGPGIVLDPAAPSTLDSVFRSSRQHGVSHPIRLLVGGSDGLDAMVVDRLVAAGWHRGRLGPTILRSELAAPVAVAVAAMLVPQV